MHRIHPLIHLNLMTLVHCGEPFASIITVDGIDVKVTDEVFRAYSQMDRQERYQAEQRDESFPVVSLELLEEHNVPIDLYLKNHELSAEEVTLVHENELERATYHAMLQNELDSLGEDERNLIYALFFERLSTRAYAKQLGVYHRTVIYRRDKILEKLRRKFFSRNP